MQNLYRARLWPNSPGKTYTVPIKKETHSFGLITPLSPHNAKAAMIIFVSCETHWALWQPGHSRANREECASLWKGWVRLTPMGCVGIGLRSKAWSSGKGRRWTATVRVGDVPSRICIPGDIERCETEGDRQREIQDFHLPHYLLAHDKPMQCERCHGLFEWEAVESGYASLLKAVYISQMSKLFYKINVGCLEND